MTILPYLGFAAGAGAALVLLYILAVKVALDAERAGYERGAADERDRIAAAQMGVDLDAPCPPRPQRPGRHRRSP